ncbi:hypothetical protein KM043_012339 [Ampulex compressa]|nr:hypothetical protein KM043_012339 [Ampulex compressa]
MMMTLLYISGRTRVIFQRAAAREEGGGGAVEEEARGGGAEGGRARVGTETVEGLGPRAEANVRNDSRSIRRTGGGERRGEERREEKGRKGKKGTPSSRSSAVIAIELGARRGEARRGEARRPACPGSRNRRVDGGLSAARGASLRRRLNRAEDNDTAVSRDSSVSGPGVERLEWRKALEFRARLRARSASPFPRPSRSVARTKTGGARDDGSALAGGRVPRSSAVGI